MRGIALRPSALRRTDWLAPFAACCALIAGSIFARSRSRSCTVDETARGALAGLTADARLAVKLVRCGSCWLWLGFARLWDV